MAIEDGGGLTRYPTAWTPAGAGEKAIVSTEADESECTGKWRGGRQHVNRKAPRIFGTDLP